MPVKIVLLTKLKRRKDLMYAAKNIAKEIRDDLSVTHSMLQDEIVAIEDIAENTNEIIIYNLSRNPWRHKTVNSIKAMTEYLVKQEISENAKVRIIEHQAL